jgi:hypothetical protein
MFFTYSNDTFKDWAEDNYSNLIWRKFISNFVTTAVLTWQDKWIFSH